MKKKCSSSRFAFSLFLAVLPSIRDGRAQEVLPAPALPFKGQIGLRAKESKPDFPQPIEAPKDSHNILLILLDDVGFAWSSTFGGLCSTPTLERPQLFTGFRFESWLSRA